MAQYGAAAAAPNTTKSSSPPPGLFADLFSSSIIPRTFKVPQKDLLVFFRQLAVVLQSGVPLSQGLDL